jgi:Flp pilus assembly protein TadG
MPPKLLSWNCFDRLEFFLHHQALRSNPRGQAIVEFTLVFLLLLVIAWIPTDFGLAFYTGQLALNASREGARIAAADVNPTSGTCNLPCAGAPAGSVLNETAKRLSSALLPNATITVTFPVAGGTACNQQVRVRVDGSYNYFFYQLLNMFGASSVPNAVNIVRQTDMRWEHQKACG